MSNFDVSECSPNEILSWVRAHPDVSITFKSIPWLDSDFSITMNLCRSTMRVSGMFDLENADSIIKILDSMLKELYEFLSLYPDNERRLK